MHVVHVCAHRQPLQGAAECLVAVEYLSGTCELFHGRLAVERFEGKYTFVYAPAKGL